MIIPNVIQLEDTPPFCWIELTQAQAEKGKCLHFNGSTGKKDPWSRYVVILRTGVKGYEYYEIDYFDCTGRWITQLAFDGLQEALDQIEFEFSIDPDAWNYCDLEG